MNKLDYLKLTQAVYRVTDKFPEGEPLKYKIREKANDILADLVIYGVNTRSEATGSLLFNPTNGEKITKNIEILDSFFEVARIQNWVDPLNFWVLEQEYNKIREDLKYKVEKKEKRDKPELQCLEVEPLNITLKEQGSVSKTKTVSISGQSRHQKILEALREKGQAQVWEIKKILPEISKRTLRRDFNFLLGQGLVERVGERNNTFYQLK